MIEGYRFLLETCYMLLIVGSALMIFFRTARLYRFSGHQGIRYFSLAFLFLAIGFFIRYATMLYLIFIMGSDATISTANILTFLMETTITLPGLFLVYSLNRRWISIPPSFLVPLAAAIALIDMLTIPLFLMYLSQIFLFSFGLITAITNYIDHRSKSRFIISLCMGLFLLVWLINFVGQYTITTYPWLRIVVYILTISITFMFLYLVTRLTKDFR